VSFYGILEKHALSNLRVAKSVRDYTEDGDRKFSLKRPYIVTRLQGDKTKKTGFFTVTVVKNHYLWIIKVLLQEIYKLKYFLSSHFTLPKCQLLIQVILGINCRTTKIMKLFYLLQKFYVQGVSDSVCSSPKVFIK